MRDMLFGPEETSRDTRFILGLMLIAFAAILFIVADTGRRVTALQKQVDKIGHCIEQLAESVETVDAAAPGGG